MRASVLPGSSDRADFGPFVDSGMQGSEVIGHSHDVHFEVLLLCAH